MWPGCDVGVVVVEWLILFQTSEKRKKQRSKRAREEEREEKKRVKSNIKRIFK